MNVKSVNQRSTKVIIDGKKLKAILIERGLKFGHGPP